MIEVRLLIFFQLDSDCKIYPYFWHQILLFSGKHEPQLSEQEELKMTNHQVQLIWETILNEATTVLKRKNLRKYFVPSGDFFPLFMDKVEDGGNCLFGILKKTRLKSLSATKTTRKK